MVKHNWVIANIHLINMNGLLIGEVRSHPDHGWYWGVGEPHMTDNGQVPSWRESSLWDPDPSKNYYATMEEAQEAAFVAAKARGLL